MAVPFFGWVRALVRRTLGAPMRIHPAANIVPLLDGAAFESLKEDIRQNGQQLPIVTWDQQILDGRNRMRACQDLGLQPKIVSLSSLPGDSPALYVISANLHRRHLTQSQLAMVGARAREHFDAEAKERQSFKCKSVTIRGDARDLAGAAIGVSGKTIDFATKVLRSGVPEVIAACEAGKLSVSRASRLVDLPPPEQRRALSTRKRALRAPIARYSERSTGVCFDRLVVRAREVRDLLGSLGAAENLVRTGHFDGAVILSAVRQLDTVAAAIQSWTQHARETLANDRMPTGCAGSPRAAE